MPSLVLGGLREKFLAGDVGDCTLKFTVEGEVAEERKADSNVLECVPHFKRQAGFSEGKNKEFSIDIGQFYGDSEISVKKFIELVFLVMFDGDVELADSIRDTINLPTRYGLVNFREYLELPYEGVIKTPLPEMDGEQRTAAKSAFKSLVTNAGEGVWQEVVDEHHFLLESAEDPDLTFDKIWQELYVISKSMLGSDDAGVKQRGKHIFEILCSKYLDGDYRPEQLQFGISGKLMESIAAIMSAAINRKYVVPLQQRLGAMFPILCPEIYTQIQRIADGHFGEEVTIPFLESADFQTGISMPSDTALAQHFVLSKLQRVLMNCIHHGNLKMDTIAKKKELNSFHTSAHFIIVRKTFLVAVCSFKRDINLQEQLDAKTKECGELRAKYETSAERSASASTAETTNSPEPGTKRRRVD